MPVRPIEKVDEVDPQRVFGSAYLPVLPLAPRVRGPRRICVSPSATDSSVAGLDRNRQHPPDDERRGIRADPGALSTGTPRIAAATAPSSRIVPPRARQRRCHISGWFG